MSIPPLQGPLHEPGQVLREPRTWPFVEQALAKREANHRRRSLQPLTPVDALRVQRHGQGSKPRSEQGHEQDSGQTAAPLLNFSANDYLGLSKHPQVIAKAVDYTQRYGTGATASRLVAGSFDIHHQLEAQLAKAVGHEAALLFGTGFQANSTLIPALVGDDAKETIIVCDRLIHNSLLNGIRASRARFIRFPHNDMAALEQRLQKAVARYQRVLIISETVFSMDGDRADVETLIALADRFNALLYLDDAHALGVLGPDGMGLAARRSRVDILVGTFGKACGASGAFVACSEPLRDYLVNFCAGVIYTTALPPSVVGAVSAALELFPQMAPERGQLAQQSDWLRNQLEQRHYGTGGSRSQIVPAIIGPERRTLALANHLEAQGYLATAIRPPTVPVNSARLRFALSCHHQREHLQGLLNALDQFETNEQ